MSYQPQTPTSVSSNADSQSETSVATFGLEKLQTATFSGLMTPPDSPVDSVVNRDDLEDDHDFYQMATGPSAVLVGDTAYTLGQIRVMADVLANARRNGEIPPTTSSPMDGHAVVKDYGHLAQLRDARGDTSMRAPQNYTQLRIEITRRIRERDELLEEQSKKEEAARRVNSYLRSVQHEHSYFEAANTILRRRGLSQPTQLDLDNISEEILAVVEHAVDQNMAEATVPLRRNMERLNQESADFRDQNDTFSRQIDLHYRNLERFNESFDSHIKALNSMFQPQATNIQAMTESLAMVSGIVNNLSQITVNLPNAINQVVYASIQHQAQAAIKEVMDAQQQVMLSLHEQDRQPSGRSSGERQCSGDSGVDIEALASAIARKMQEEKSVSRRESRRLREKFGRAIRRIFRCRWQGGSEERIGMNGL